MALAFYGGWIDFLPEPWVERSSFYVALVLGVAVTVWLAWVNLTGRNEAYQGGTAKMLLAAPFCAALAAGFIWCALAHGVAGGVTRMLGDAAFLPPVQMHTVHRRRRRECDYQLRGAPLPASLSATFGPVRPFTGPIRGIAVGGRWGAFGGGWGSTARRSAIVGAWG